MDVRVARNVDWVLVGAVLALGLFGLFALRLATGGWHQARQQAIWLLVGLAVMVVVALLDYHVWVRWAREIYVGNIVMLAGVLVVGHRALGAQRWIGFGPFHLQPSEIAKIAVIMTVASLTASRFGRLHGWRPALVPALAVLPPILLVALQPDLGTSLVFVAILIGLLYAAGMSGWRIVLATLTVIAVAVGVLYAHQRWHVPVPLKQYQIQRLVVFTNPQSDPLGQGFHILQSEIAIGSGELHGRGLGRAASGALSYLPESTNDFIFAVIAERLGFMGAAALLVGFFVLLWRGARISAQARDPYGACLAGGVVAMLAFHVFVNVGMTMGMMPVTGVPLPFTSSGGSALVADFAGVGLLMSVYMRRKKIQF